jgi:hypothetical protein
LYNPEDLLIYQVCFFIVFVQNEIVLRTNLPTEEHASQVYTGEVYELSVQTICESEPIVVEAVIANLKYIAPHPNSKTREK